MLLIGSKHSRHQWIPSSLLVCAGVSIVACVAYGFIKGEDGSWDQLNYHLYDVYALLNQRLHVDVAPAELQTWYNPFGELLQYGVVRYLPPLIAGAVLAIIPALSIPLVFVITKNCLITDEFGKHKTTLLCWLASIGALVGPMFLSEVGTTSSDDIGAIVILSALAIVLMGRFNIRSYFFAGLMLGLALDIKITNAAFVVGWVIALIAVERKCFIRPLAVSAIGAFISYLPIGGLWNLYMYSIFKNPLFPYYNELFKSAAYFSIPMVDTSFRPTSFAGAMSFFAKWALGGTTVSSEASFRDLRYMLALLLAIIALPQVIKLVFGPRADKIGHPFQPKQMTFVLLFVIVSFSVWLGYSGISRYAIAIEQLGLLFIFICLALIAAPGRQFVQAAMMCTLAVVFTTHPADWGRTHFGGTWAGISIPNALKKEDTLYVMLSGDPFAFVISSFPKSDVFVRMEGNLPLTPEVGLGRDILAKIKAHKGKIRSLAPVGYSLQNSNALMKFGLAPSSGPCWPIDSKRSHLQSCPLALRRNSES
jgi:hypothetical protein